MTSLYLDLMETYKDVWQASSYREAHADYVIRASGLRDKITQMGTISRCINHGGYGFVASEEGSELFFHFSDCEENWAPMEGDNVEFELGENSKGMCAKNLKVV